jgi:hypothetical protein
MVAAAAPPDAPEAEAQLADARRETSAPVARLRVDTLPPPCPDEAHFRADVAARLGRDPFVATGNEEIRVRAIVAAERLALSVDALSGDTRLGTRELEGHVSDCSELLSRAALTTSVLLDPLTSIFAAPVRAEAAPEAPAATAAPVVVVEEPERRPRPGLSSSVHAGVLAVAGRQPGVGIGGRVGIVGRLPVALPVVDAVSVGVELRGTAPSAAQAGGGEVLGAEAALTFLPCGSAWFVELCGVVDGGGFFGAGRSLHSPADGILPSGALGGRLNILLPIGAGLGIVASGELLVPVTHHRLRALDSDSVLWETAPIAGSMGAAVVWEIGSH